MKTNGKLLAGAGEGIHSRLARLKSPFWSSQTRLAYLFMLPATLFLAAFMIYPIINVIGMSFFKANKIGKLIRYVGLGNYISLLSERDFLEVMARSVYWTGLAVAVKTICGMLLAVMLNVRFKGRKLARTLIIIPWASSIPISTLLWGWVYHPEFGLLSHTLKLTGLWPQPPIWLGSAVSAFFSVIWVDIWLGIPFFTLVFLAAMQAIPGELYEAADADGVNAFQKYLYITLPGITDVLLISTLLSILWTFNDFNAVYILTKGGPAGSTQILITYIYEMTFEWLKWDYGAVMAVITFVILSIVAFLYARLYFKREAQS
jgi:multiple sugar transport system permease protein